MQLVNQTKFPQRGNCFRACLATIMGIDIDEMPDFEEQSDTVWIPAKKWLLEHGFTLRNYHKDFAPKNYSIATGQSPRNPNIHHAVVALDGVQYFDPHPDRSGLVSIERYWQIEDANPLSQILATTILEGTKSLEEKEPVEEKADDDMQLCSYPEMSPMERYELRKNNKPSFTFKIDTIAIKIINEAEQSNKPEEAPKIETIPSSNVYADLGYENAEEMFSKAQVVIRIKQTIKSLGWYYATFKHPCTKGLNLESICRGNFRNISLDRLEKLEADLSSTLNYRQQPCDRIYKSQGCGYAGDLPSCNKSVEDCEAHFPNLVTLPHSHGQREPNPWELN